MQKTDAIEKTSGKSAGDTARSKTGAGNTDRASLNTPSDLTAKQTLAVATKVNGLVADAYVLYLKTKNFHWHVAGPNFRDYHLMLDEQADQIYASIDPLAERVRKLGHTTIHSFAQILKLTSLDENTAEYVGPHDMLVELMDDNKSVAKSMREVHKVCDDNDDVATASLLEVYIDETERRTWFLFETARNADAGGH
jgi:starvation-inducible DNA-binding protein